jgi:hypothetical protein
VGTSSAAERLVVSQEEITSATELCHQFIPRLRIRFIIIHFKIKHQSTL